MNKIIILLLIFTFGFVSCKKTEKPVNKLKIAKQFYETLDNSDSSKFNSLLAEHLTTVDDGFEKAYTHKGYKIWLKWDAVFAPTYNIIKMEQEGEVVRAKISKLDKRIQFLHEAPIVTEEIIRFDNGKIKSVERKSSVFNVARFIENREKLVTWIKHNHPDLNGFLHDQTETGGVNYLKAIELYKNRNHSH